MKATTWYAGGRHVRVGDRSVFVREQGSGPALLFIHGFPTSSLDWVPVVERVGDRHRCVAFDLLGFGASSKPRIDYSYALQWTALDEVVRACNLDEAVVVAHDYGATLGQEILARCAEGRLPFELRGMVLLNSALVPSLHRPIAVQRLLASRLGPFLAPLVVGRRAFARSLARVIHRMDRIDVDEHWEALARDGGTRILPRLLHYIAERRVHGARWVEALRRVEVPLGFVWGRRDPVSGAHVLAWIREALPSAPVLELDVGHYPQLEAPDEVATWLIETVAVWSARTP